MESLARMKVYLGHYFCTMNQPLEISGQKTQIPVPRNGIFIPVHWTFGVLAKTTPTTDNTRLNNASFHPVNMTTLIRIC